MRRHLPAQRLLPACLLLLLPLCASAGEGVNLAWNHCLGEGTGVQNAVFACDTNAGSHVLVGSFVLGANLPTVSGFESVTDLVSASPVLPAWWEFRNAGSCRQGSLTASLSPDPANVVCVDWSNGAAAGGLAAYCVTATGCADSPAAANAARIKVVGAVSVANIQNLSAGVEYFVFSLAIDHAKTVGAGACTGCSTPVCLVLNSILCARPVGLGDHKISGGTAPGTNFATWQGGAVAGIGCPAATAVRRSHWSAVKALYR